MQINNPIMEGCCTGTQIQIPHPHKPFIKHFPYFVYMFFEILFPAQQCPIIMQTQIFHINRMEIIFCSLINHFP